MDHVDKFNILVNKFNEDAAAKFATAVEQASFIDPNHPITITIDSYGGYVHSLLNMIETLNSVPNPIITYCKGKAMSCGAVLLSVGDQRFCGKESVVMIHELSGGAIGNVDDIKWDAAESVRLNVQMMTLLAKNCGMSYEEMKARVTADGRRDWNLTAKEAKDIGLVHSIGTPLIKPIVMYAIETAPEKKFSFENQAIPKTKPKPRAKPKAKAKTKKTTIKKAKPKTKAKPKLRPKAKTDSKRVKK